MSDQTQAAAPDFETAIAELEAIVSQLESGRLPLAQSVSVYQRGAELLQRCQQSLSEAEQQIRILTETGHLVGFNLRTNPQNERHPHSKRRIRCVGGKKLRHLENVLDQHLPSPEIKPERLHEAMRYSTLEGGKRVRALLVYAAAEFCGADIERADIPAAAVELIHAFSLVHDDLPCMDNDDMRRGKPSTHKQYGDAMALLVGDALQSLAFQLISQDSHLKGPQKVKMLHVLALASGSRGMAGGQAIDLESMGIPLTQEELETMHIHKTGALIRASALLGAYCAVRPNEDKLKAVDHFAKAIGLAFQVVDDILDTESDTQTLGKTAGKDAQANKSTYVTILGISRAKELAEELHANAMAALSFYGREADLLRHLGNFVMRRNH